MIKFPAAVLLLFFIGVRVMGVSCDPYYPWPGGSCQTCYYLVEREILWDSAEVVVLNFRSGPVTLRMLEHGELTDAVSVEQIGLTNTEIRNIFRWMEHGVIYHDWKPGLFDDHPRNLRYDAGEIPAAAEYHHDEGKESLTLIIVYDEQGNTICMIPFEGHRSETMGFSVYQEWEYVCLESADDALPGFNPKSVLGHADPDTLPMTVQGRMQVSLVYEWDLIKMPPEEDLFLERISNWYIERVYSQPALTNPRIYILLREF